MLSSVVEALHATDAQAGRRSKLQGESKRLARGTSHDRLMARGQPTAATSGGRGGSEACAPEGSGMDKDALRGLRLLKAKVKSGGRLASESDGKVQIVVA